MIVPTVVGIKLRGRSRHDIEPHSPSQDGDGRHHPLPAARLDHLDPPPPLTRFRATAAPKRWIAAVVYEGRLNSLAKALHFRTGSAVSLQQDNENERKKEHEQVKPVYCFMFTLVNDGGSEGLRECEPHVGKRCRCCNHNEMTPRYEGGHEKIKLKLTW